MSPELPLVTVLVCAHDYERYVAEAIDSALAQDYPADRLEVLVVDDGSTDGTPGVLAGYGEAIRVVRQANAGLNAATAAGIREARGDLVGILDADDAWLPGKLRTQVDLLLARPEVGLVYSDLELVDAAGEVLAPSFFEHLGLTPADGRGALAALLCGNSVPAPSILFRRELSDRVLPIPAEASFQDWWIAVRIAEVAELACVPEPLVRYRRHGENMAVGSSGEKLLANLRGDNRFRRWMLRELPLDALEPEAVLAGWSAYASALAAVAEQAAGDVREEVEVTGADRAECSQHVAVARAAEERRDDRSAVRSWVAARACDPWDRGAEAGLERASALAAVEPPAPRHGTIGAAAPSNAGKVYDLVSDAPGLERLLPLFDARDPWQMSFGERTGLVSILDMVEPAVAVEIGTCEGASLRRIASRSGHVHSFDVWIPDPAIVAEVSNVTFHTGDSHVSLAPFLRGLAAQGLNVDFALVDGDHTAGGVRRDMLDLLESDAVGRTVILLHDTFNEDVRRGLEAIDYDAFEKVLHVELDWIPGHTFRGRLEGESWGGLGLVVCDARHPRAPGRTSRQGVHHPSVPLPAASATLGRVVLAHYEELLDGGLAAWSSTFAPQDEVTLAITVPAAEQDRATTALAEAAGSARLAETLDVRVVPVDDDEDVLALAEVATARLGAPGHDGLLAYDVGMLDDLRDALLGVGPAPAAC